MEKQILPKESEDVAEFGLGDWWEQIKSQVGDALEKAEKKAKEILEGIQVVGEDAWEKIKEAAKGLEVAKDKFVESILPKILEALKEVSHEGGAALETAVDGIIDLLKELGVNSLEKALSYIVSHKADIEGKIYEIITAHLMAAIDKAIGHEAFAFHAVDDDTVKLVLIKMLDRCQAMDSTFEASAFLTLKPLGFQRSVRILRDMMIENPVNAEMIDSLVVRLEAADAVVAQASGSSLFHGGNIFEDILKKILAKAEADPVGVAKIIIGIFVPLGKEAVQVVVNNLRKVLEEAPTESLKIIVEMLERALNEAKAAEEIDWTKKLRREAHGKDIIEALKAIAEAALKNLVDGASSLKEVEEKLVKDILPKLIAIVKNVANKTSEAAGKVGEVVVSLLRRLGSRAIKLAIAYIDEHAESIGERLHDFLLQMLQDALAEITYVREEGFAHLAFALNRGRA